MSDYDRGAYTPQTDAPLAFDPRRPSERRPLPMALIGSAVVLVILLAGVAMVYRGGVRHAGESPRPVGEPVMAVKTAPPPPATVQTADASSAPPANMDVYNAGAANSTAAGANQLADTPTFAQPAEQPAPRPAPKPATVAMLSKPSAPTHIERPPTPTETAAASASKPHSVTSAAAKKASVSATRTTATKIRTADTTQPPATAAIKAHLAPAVRGKLDESELAAAGMTRTVDSDSDEDAVTPPATPVHKAKPEIAASATATTTPTGKAAVVQIGAFSSSILAEKGYADVSAALPGKMGGKAKHVQPLDKDGTTLYRTWLSGFANRADAEAFCSALKAKGKTCLVRG